MTTAKTIKCCRCNGTGLVFGDRQCFRCNGAGSVVADVFLRVIGTSGQFFGITGPVVNGRRYKIIARGTSGEIADDLTDGEVATEITEEQARRFFKRYGISTQVQA